MRINTALCPYPVFCPDLDRALQTSFLQGPKMAIACVNLSQVRYRPVFVQLSYQVLGLVINIKYLDVLLLMLITPFQAAATITTNLMEAWPAYILMQCNWLAIA